MDFGFFRACCVSPELKVADCEYNSRQIIDSVRAASASGANLVVFPELSITSSTAGDLFFQRSLQKAAVSALEKIASRTAFSKAIVLVGLPLCVDGFLYSVAAVIFRGEVVALVPKTYIPNHAEFSEKRYFSSAPSKKAWNVRLSDRFFSVPFGTDILIRDGNGSGFVLAVELSEDVFAPVPPSSLHALSGATVVSNLASSSSIAGRDLHTEKIVQAQSGRCVCAYLYSNCGPGESTQDSVFSGRSLVFENGKLLSEKKAFSDERMIFSDIDIELLLQDRMRSTIFSDCSSKIGGNSHTVVEIDLKNQDASKKTGLFRRVRAFPFVPENIEERGGRCAEVFEMQARALAGRLRHLNLPSVLVGLSGGLDSTLALLVAARAFDICGVERKKIISVTMPCFGTSDRTYRNAISLAAECGVSMREIDIRESVRRHFSDISHSEDVHDAVYENAQARERTQVLMDLANKEGGIVIGTGDLSELALGWCTYNGDQMSMYGVNASVPKTLIRHIVKWYAENLRKTDCSGADGISGVLFDILDTPVSPELLPSSDGKISQKTEELVGPYELHDFYLYHMVRFGFSPSKILFLADESSLPYGHSEKLRWLKNFYRRFFSQQFKRNCAPDGQKVGCVGLSARGDWRMPSDASAEVWLSEIEGLK